MHEVLIRSRRHGPALHRSRALRDPQAAPPGDPAAAALLRRRDRRRLGGRAPLPRRLGVRRARAAAGRARPLRHPPDQGRELPLRRRRRGPARTASSTSAATAAPASSSEPEGTMRRLQCPYHAWCYGFDGSLKSAPHTEEIEDFDPATSGLNRLRMEEVHGLLFADVSGTAGPLAEHLGELHAAPRALPPRRPPARRRDHLRRRGQLEGDRRELLRVPALPGRAPRAQPPLALHERRGVRGRRRLVRRLDDAHRGRRDDGRQRRPRQPAARSPG